MPVLRLVFSLLLAVTSIKCQCTVSTETIVSPDVCAVVTQGPLSYTCTHNDDALSWTSTVWTGGLTVTVGVSPAIPALVNISGVTLMESNNNNNTCLSSTLTFNGDLSALTQLNNATLFCGVGLNKVNMSIIVPILPGSPSLMSGSPSITCSSNGNQVTLLWTPPTNTGGQGVMITHYAVTGIPQSASCSTGPCDMVNGTTTTITGLQCNDSFIVSVKAFNCRGGGSSLQVPINLNPPGVPSFSNTNTVNCIDNDDILLDWTALMAVQSDCGSSLSYNLTVSDTDSVMTADTNARVPVGGNNYTVTIFASNGCPGVAEEIVISTTCVTPSSTAPPSAVSTMTPTTSVTTAPPGAGIGPVAGGAVGGIIVVAGLSALIGFILGCVCCPCLACCLLCRKKLCGCCPESWICYGPYTDDVEYGEPTPHYEKQPVKETKEKDVETGQPSYPPGPMYQDPNTIQRQAAPCGDLYAQPEKPARHQKQKPAVEMATYQDPNTIQRQAAPTTGDLYAQPEKPLKQPPGPAPVYSQVDKPQPGGIEYADLSHSEAPPNARRPAPVADTFYAQVRESRS